MTLQVLVCLAVCAAAPPPAAAPQPATPDPRAAATVTGAPRAAHAPAAKRGAEPRELLGRWEMLKEPGRIVELKPGGTGTIDGLPLTWSVEGSRLTITDPGGTDTVGWRVEGDRLVLAGPFDTEIVLARR